MLQKGLVVLLISLIYFSARGQKFWQQTGGPEGGHLQRLSVNSKTGDVFAIFQAPILKGNGAVSYLYRSTNNGASWQSVGSNLKRIPIIQIAHNPVNANVVIVTMDTVKLLSGVNAGIYFSSDTGKTFVQKNITSFPGTDWPIALIYNNAGDTLFAGKINGGVMFSPDNGATWTSLNSGLGNIKIRSFEFAFGGDLFLGTDSLNIGLPGSVYRLNGNTWSLFMAGLPSSPRSVNGLQFDQNLNTLYAVVKTGNTAQIYRSVNGGNWMLIPGYAGDLINKFEILSNGHLVVHTQKTGIYKYDLTSWSPINSGLSTFRILSIAIDNSDNIYAGTFGGLWFFPASGNSWITKNEGLIATGCRTLTFSANGDIITGTENGIYRSADAGLTWTHNALADTAIMAFGLNPFNGILLAGNTDPVASTIFVSNDDGQSWSSDSVSGVMSVRSADFAYNSQGKMYCGTGWGKPLHWSFNGLNWNNQTWTALGYPAGEVTIAVAVDSNDRVYTGHEDIGVWRSTDSSAASFQYLGLTGGDVTDIAVSPSQDVWVTHDVINVNPPGSLYRITNNGATWSANLLPQGAIVNCVEVASSDSIYAGTSTGVWFTHDTGDTWEQLNSGLAHVDVHALEISPDGYLYAATSGGGIYKSVNKIKGSTILSTSTLEVAGNNPALKVYPNPTSGTFQIEFSSVDNTMCQISLFNTIGECVLSEKVSVKPGNNKIALAPVLENGIYYLRLSHPRYTEIQKIVIKN